MRLSCNGCRVLRKGCGDSCSIRPCLQWIKSPAAQSNATVFLAKFYGRAGLLNLVNAAPQHLRPAVFRSLLYEACGRIVNPIYGSVGLLWSGNWNMCQAAVEAVLKGAPIVKISSDEAAADTPSPAHLHKAAYDIRHVAASSSSDKPGRLKKRTSASSAATAAATTTTARSNKKSKKAAPDDDHQQQQVSTASDHHHLHVVEPMDSDDAEAAGSHVSQAEQSTHSEREAEQSIHNERESEQSTHDEQQIEEKPQGQLGLDLTLGFVPIPAPCVPRPAPDAGDAGCSITGTGWTAHEPAFRFL